MDELCRKLQAARERAGLSLEDLSARTKISLTKLRSLETGGIARLPADFYTRALLSTYAREVQLPPQDVLREYDMLRAPVPPPDLVADTGNPIGETPYTRRTERAGILTRSNRWAAAIFGAFVLIVVVTTWRQAGTRAEEPAPVGTSGATAPVAAHHEAGSPAPTGTSGRAEPSAAAAALTAPLSVDLEASAPVWVTAKADGKRQVYRLVHAGEHVTLNAHEEVTFRVGNAGAIAYTINGARGKAVGRPGEVRQVTITRQNAGTFKQ